MRDLESRTYYELLGVEPDASVDQIKEAYREIARIYHPDSNFYSDIVEDTSTNEDSDVFKAITSAYQVLINEEKRRAYDDSLPKNLDSWDDDSEGLRSAVPDSGAGSFADKVRKPTETIPEEWRREREYFEAHYEEILRPAPHANLVGNTSKDESAPTDAQLNAQFESWEDAKSFAAGTRFGEIEHEVDGKVPYMTAPTRRAVRASAGFGGMDPMTALLYIGIPALLSIVLIELYLFL